MARGRLHLYLNTNKEDKTACGIDKERVETTAYKEIVNCQKCRRTNKFWKIRK